MQIGTSTVSFTILTISESIAASSKPGMPAFRSSTRAPAATCARASDRTVS